MRKQKVFALLASGLFLCVTTLQAEQPPIQWIVKDGHEASTNKLQAERLYLAACQWVEDRFGSPNQAIRPSLTIHVGEPCPDPSIAGSCQGSWLGELYIPEWDVASPGDVVQIALTMSLLELVPRQELRDVTLELLSEDVRHFLDAPAVAQMSEE